MDTRTNSFALDAALLMRGPDGRPLPAHAVAIAYTTSEGAIVECRLTLALSPEVYRRVDQQELFHLVHSARENGARLIRPDRPVRLEARLDGSLLLLLPQHPGQADGPAGEPRAAPPAAALLLTESWYALHITQEITAPDGEGTLRFRYSTSWAVAAVSSDLPPAAVRGAAQIESRTDEAPA